MKDNLVKLREKTCGSNTLFYNLDDKELYTREDGFVPRKGSMFFKPSFAGRKVLLGIYKGEEQFSNGVWFSVGQRELDDICDRIGKTLIEIR